MLSDEQFVKTLAEEFSAYMRGQRDRFRAILRNRSILPDEIVPQQENDARGMLRNLVALYVDFAGVVDLIAAIMLHNMETRKEIRQLLGASAGSPQKHAVENEYLEQDKKIIETWEQLDKITKEFQSKEPLLNWLDRQYKHKAKDVTEE